MTTKEPSAPAQLDSALTHSLPGKPHTGLPTLLVVDDQRLNIEMLNEVFEADHEVCAATSGAEALAFCQSRLPDLILLDVVMPDMDGYEVCRKLKHNPLTRDIPVIFVSARDTPLDETRGLNEGAVDFISRPLIPQIVRARVKTHLTLKFQSDILRSLAFIDGLTGVGNRRNFDETLAAEWRHCVRAKEPLSLIMIDIDYFKLYNDHYGHQSGDDCLRQIANALQGCLSRSHDLVARYGGEEFACVLPDTPLEGAEKIALQLAAAVDALAIPHEASLISKVVTISQGVAVAMPARGDDPSSLIAAADDLLYQAKLAGRKQIKSERY